MAIPIEEQQDFRDPLVDFAQGIVDATRMRDAALGQSVFGEPAWDIFLTIFASEPRTDVSVSELANRCMISEEVTRRWLAVLSSNNLVVLDGDLASLQIDARRRLRRVLMTMATNVTVKVELPGAP